MRDPFIKVPFASSGDKSSIPDATQPNGSISMQSGWGIDYEKEVGVDPAAKSVNRQDMNQVLNLLSTLANRWQTESHPEWIDSAANGGVPVAYPIGTAVNYSTGSVMQAWVNKLAGNTASPSAANNWVLLSDVAAAFRDPTEVLRGMPSIATQTETNDGLDDAKVVTSKKLRFGFSASYGSNGFITFPTWLGGWVFQWMRVSLETTNNDSGQYKSPNLSWPTMFPTAIYQAGAAHIGAASVNTYSIFDQDLFTQSQFRLKTPYVSGSASWMLFAVGK